MWNFVTALFVFFLATFEVSSTADMGSLTAIMDRVQEDDAETDIEPYANTLFNRGYDNGIPSQQNLRKDIVALTDSRLQYNKGRSVLIRDGTFRNILTDVHDHEGTFSAFGKQEKIFNLLSQIKLNLNEGHNFFSIPELLVNASTKNIKLQEILEKRSLTTLNPGLANSSINNPGYTKNIANFGALLAASDARSNYIGTLSDDYSSQASLTYCALINEILKLIRTVPIHFGNNLNLGSPEESSDHSLYGQLIANDDQDLANLIYGMTQIGSRGFSPTLLQSIKKALADNQTDTLEIKAVNLFTDTDCWSILFGNPDDIQKTQGADPAGSLWEQFLFLTSHQDPVTRQRCFNDTDAEELTTLFKKIASKETIRKKLPIDPLKVIFQYLIPANPVLETWDPTEAFDATKLSLQECLNYLLSDTLSDTSAVTAQIKTILQNIESLLIDQKDFSPYQRFYHSFSQISAYVHTHPNEGQKSLIMALPLLKTADTSSETAFWETTNTSLEKLCDIFKSQPSNLLFQNYETSEAQNDNAQYYVQSLKTFFQETVLLFQSLQSDLTILLSNLKDRDPKWLALLERLSALLLNISQDYDSIIISPDDEDLPLKEEGFQSLKIEILKTKDIIDAAIRTHFQFVDFPAVRNQDLFDLLPVIKAGSKQIKGMPSLYINHAHSKDLSAALTGSNIFEALPKLKESLPFPIQVLSPDYSNNPYADEILWTKAFALYQDCLNNTVSTHLHPPILDELWHDFSFQPNEFPAFWERFAQMICIAIDPKFTPDLLDTEILKRELSKLQNTWNGFENFHRLTLDIKVANAFAFAVDALDQSLKNITNFKTAFSVLKTWHELIGAFLLTDRSNFSEERLNQFINRIKNLTQKEPNKLAICLNSWLDIPDLFKAATHQYYACIDHATQKLAEFFPMSFPPVELYQFEPSLKDLTAFWKNNSWNRFVSLFTEPLNTVYTPNFFLSFPDFPLKSTAAFWNRLLQKMQIQTTCCTKLANSLFDIVQSLESMIIVSNKALKAVPEKPNLEQTEQTLNFIIQTWQDPLTSFSQITAELQNCLSENFTFAPEPATHCALYSAYLTRILNQLVELKVHLQNLPVQRQIIIDKPLFSQEQVQTLFNIIEQLNVIAKFPFPTFQAAHSLKENALIYVHIQEELSNIANALSTIHYFLSQNEDVANTFLITQDLLRWIPWIQTAAQQLSESSIFHDTLATKMVKTAALFTNYGHLWNEFCQNPSTQSSLNFLLEKLWPIWSNTPSSSTIPNQSEDPCTLVQHAVLSLAQALNQLNQGLIKTKNLAKMQILHRNPQLRSALTTMANFCSTLSLSIQTSPGFCPLKQQNLHHTDFQHLLRAQLHQISQSFNDIAALPVTCLSEEISDWHQKWKTLIKNLTMLVFGCHQIEQSLSQGRIPSHKDLDPLLVNSTFSTSAVERSDQLAFLIRNILQIYDHVDPISLISPPLPSENDPISVFETGLAFYDQALNEIADSLNHMALFISDGLTPLSKAYIQNLMASLQDSALPLPQHSEVCWPIFIQSKQSTQNVTSALRSLLDATNEKNCLTKVQLLANIRRNLETIILFIDETDWPTLPPKNYAKFLVALENQTKIDFPDYSIWLITLNQALEKIAQHFSVETVPSRFPVTCDQEQNYWHFIAESLQNFGTRIQIHQQDIPVEFLKALKNFINIFEQKPDCPCLNCQSYGILALRIPLHHLNQVLNLAISKSPCQIETSEGTWPSIEQTLYTLTHQLDAIEHSLNLDHFQINNGQNFLTHLNQQFDQLYTALQNTPKQRTDLLKETLEQIKSELANFIQQYPLNSLPVLSKDQRYKNVLDLNNVALSRFHNDLNHCFQSLDRMSFLWNVYWEPSLHHILHTPPSYILDIHHLLKKIDWSYEALQKKYLEILNEANPFNFEALLEKVSLQLDSPFQEIADRYGQLQNREKESQWYHLFNAVKEFQFLSQLLSNDKALFFIFQAIKYTCPSALLETVDLWNTVNQSLRILIPEAKLEPYPNLMTPNTWETYAQQTEEILIQIFEFLKAKKFEHPYCQNILPQRLASLLFPAIQHDCNVCTISPTLLSLCSEFLSEKQTPCPTSDENSINLEPIATLLTHGFNMLPVVTDHSSDTNQQDAYSQALETLSAQLKNITASLNQTSSWNEMTQIFRKIDLSFLENTLLPIQNVTQAFTAYIPKGSSEIYLTHILKITKALSSYFESWSLHNVLNNRLPQQYSSRLLGALQTFTDQTEKLSAALKNLASKTQPFDAYQACWLTDLAKDINFPISSVADHIRDRFWKEFSMCIHHFLQMRERYVKALNQMNTIIKNYASGWSGFFANKFKNEALQRTLNKINITLQNWIQIFQKPVSSNPYETLQEYSQSLQTDWYPNLKDTAENSFFEENWKEIENFETAQIYDLNLLCQDIAKINAASYQDVLTNLEASLQKQKTNRKIETQKSIKDGFYDLADFVNSFYCNSFPMFIQNIQNIAAIRKETPQGFDTLSFGDLKKSATSVSETLEKIGKIYDVSTCCDNLLSGLDDIANSILHLANQIAFISERTTDWHVLLPKIDSAFLKISNLTVKEKSKTISIFKSIQKLYTGGKSCSADEIQDRISLILSEIRSLSEIFETPENAFTTYSFPPITSDKTEHSFSKQNQKLEYAFLCLIQSLNSGKALIQSEGAWSNNITEILNHIDSIKTTFRTFETELFSSLVDPEKPYGNFCDSCSQKNTATEKTYNAVFQDIANTLSQDQTTLTQIQDTLRQERDHREEEEVRHLCQNLFGLQKALHTPSSYKQLIPLLSNLKEPLQILLETSLDFTAPSQEQAGQTNPKIEALKTVNAVFDTHTNFTEFLPQFPYREEDLINYEEKIVDLIRQNCQAIRLLTQTMPLPFVAKTAQCIHDLACLFSDQKANHAFSSSTIQAGSVLRCIRFELNNLYFDLKKMEQQMLQSKIDQIPESLQKITSIFYQYAVTIQHFSCSNRDLTFSQAQNALPSLTQIAQTFPNWTDSAESFDSFAQQLKLCHQHLINGFDLPDISPNLAVSDKVQPLLTSWLIIFQKISDSLKFINIALEQRPVVRYHKDLFDQISQFAKKIGNLRDITSSNALKALSTNVSDQKETSLILSQFESAAFETTANLNHMIDTLNRRSNSYLYAFNQAKALYLEGIAQAFISISETDLFHFQKFLELSRLVNTLTQHVKTLTTSQNPSEALLEKLRFKVLDGLHNILSFVKSWAQTEVTPSVLNIPFETEQNSKARIQEAYQTMALFLLENFQNYTDHPFKLNADLIAALKTVKQSLQSLNAQTLCQALHSIITKLEQPTCCQNEAELLKSIEKSVHILIIHAIQTAQNAYFIYQPEKAKDFLSNLNTCLERFISLDFQPDCLQEDAFFAALKNTLQTFQNQTVTMNVPDEDFTSIPWCLRRSIFVHRLEHHVQKLPFLCDMMTEHLFHIPGKALPYEAQIPEQILNVYNTGGSFISALQSWLQQFILCPTCQTDQQDFITPIIQTIRKLPEISDQFASLKTAKLTQQFYKALYYEKWIRSILDSTDHFTNFDCVQMNSLLKAYALLWNDFGNRDLNSETVLVQFLQNIEWIQKRLIELINVDAIAPPQFSDIVFSSEKLDLFIQEFSALKEQHSLYWAKFLNRVEARARSQQPVSNEFRSLVLNAKHIFDKIDQDLTTRTALTQSILFLPDSKAPLCQIQSLIRHNCQLCKDVLSSIHQTLRKIKEQTDNIVSFAFNLGALDLDVADLVLMNLREVWTTLTSAIEAIIPELETYLTCQPHYCFSENDYGVFGCLETIQSALEECLNILSSLPSSSSSSLEFKNFAELTLQQSLPFSEKIASSWTILNQELQHQCELLNQIEFLIQNIPSCQLTEPATQTLALPFIHDFQKLSDLSQIACQAYEDSLYADLITALQQIAADLPLFDATKHLLFQNNIIDASQKCLSGLVLPIKEMASCLTTVRSAEDRQIILNNLQKIVALMPSIQQSMNAYLIDREQAPFERHQVIRDPGNASKFQMVLSVFPSMIVPIIQSLDQWKTLLENQTGKDQNERCFDQNAVTALEQILQSIIQIKDLYADHESQIYLANLHEHFSQTESILKSVLNLIKTATCCALRDDYLFTFLPIFEQLNSHLAFVEDSVLPSFEPDDYLTICSCLNQSSTQLSLMAQAFQKIKILPDQHCVIPELALSIQKAIEFLDTGAQEFIPILNLLSSPDKTDPQTIDITQPNCPQASDLLTLIDREIFLFSQRMQKFMPIFSRIELNDQNFSLKSELENFLSSLIEITNSLKSFFDQAPLCINCDDFSKFHQNLLINLNSLHEAILSTLAALEEQKYASLASTFHQFIQHIKREKDLWQAFVSCQTDDFKKESIKPFERFLLSAQTTYQEILKKCQTYTASSSNVFASQTQWFQSLNQALSSYHDRQKDILQTMGISFKSSINEPYLSNFGYESLLNDYETLQNILKEFNTLWIQFSSPKLRHHCALKGMWKNLEMTWQMIADNLPDLEILQKPKLEFWALHNFIQVLETEAPHYACPDSLQQLFTVFVNLNVLLSSNLQHFMNMPDFNRPKFLQSLSNIKDTVTGLSDFLQSLSSSIDEFNQTYAITFLAPDFWTIVPEIFNKAQTLYDEVEKIIRIFAGNAFIQPKIVMQTFPNTENIFTPLYQQIKKTIPLLTDLFAIAQKAPVRDLYEGSVLALKEVSSAFSSLADTFPVIDLHCCFDAIESQKECQNLKQAFQQMSLLFSKEAKDLEEFCCSRFIYTIFENLDELSLTVQTLEMAEIAPLIHTLSDQDNPLKNFISFANNFIKSNNNFSEIFPDETEGASLYQRHQSLNRTQNFLKSNSSFFEAIMKVFKTSFSPVQSKIIHPELYRCEALPSAVSQWETLLIDITDTIANQIATMNNEKFDPVVVRPLFELCEAFKSWINDFKIYIQNFDFQHIICKNCATNLIAFNLDLYDQLIDVSSEFQELLDRYCFCQAAKELDLYNQHMYRIKEIIDILAEKPSDFWPAVNTLMFEQFLPIYEGENGLNAMLKSILSIDTNGFCQFDKLAQILSAMSKQRKTMLSILSQTLNVNINPVTSPYPDTYAISLDQTYQILNDTHTVHNDLFISFQNLSKNISQENLEASSTFIATLKNLSNSFSTLSLGFEQIYTKWKSGFFCEKFNTCPVCDSCNPCPKIAGCLCFYPNEVRHILWDLKSIYANLSELFIDVSNKINGQCCLSSFRILFPIQESLLKAQTWISHILSQTHDTQALFAIFDLWTNYFNQSSDVLTIIHEKQLHNHLDICTLELLNEEFEYLNNLTLNFEQKSSDLLETLSLSKPDVRNLENLDTYCYEFPWFLRNINDCLSQLSSDISSCSLIYETQECANQGQLFFKNLETALQKGVQAFRNLFLNDDQCMFCPYCDKIKFNEKILQIATSLEKLKNSTEIFHVRAIRNFCCQSFQKALAKFFGNYQTLAQALDELEDSKLVEILDSDKSVQLLSQISDALSDIYSNQIKLFSKIKSCSAENSCQSFEIAKSINAINEQLENDVYPLFSALLDKPLKTDLLASDLSLQPLNTSLCKIRNQLTGLRRKTPVKILDSLQLFIQICDQNSLDLFDLSLRSPSICSQNSYHDLLINTQKDFLDLSQTLLGLYHDLSLYTDQRPLFCLNEIQDLLHRFVLCVRSTADVPSIIEKWEQNFNQGNLPLKDLLSYWQNEFENIDQSLLTFQFDTPLATLTDIKESLEHLLYITLTLPVHPTFEPFREKALSYDEFVQTLHIELADLSEAFIWLANDIEFLHPDGPPPLSEALQIQQIFEKIINSLADLPDPSFQPVIKALQYSDLTLAKGIAILSSQIQDLATAIHAVQKSASSAKLLPTFFEKAMSFEPWSKDLENFDKTHSSGLADLVTHSPVLQLAQLLSSKKSDPPKVRSLDHAFLYLQQSLSNLHRQLVLWNSELTNQTFDTESDLNLPLALDQTQAHLATLLTNVNLPNLSSQISLVCKAFTDLFLTLKADSLQNRLQNILSFVQSITQNDKGESILNELYQTRFNNDGLPIMNKDGKIATIPDTFLQKTQSILDFGIVLNNALFMKSYANSIL